MPRPILILVLLLLVVVAMVIGLAALDREVPVTHVEQPVAANATAQ